MTMKPVLLSRTCRDAFKHVISVFFDSPIYLVIVLRPDVCFCTIMAAEEAYCMPPRRPPKEDDRRFGKIGDLPSKVCLYSFKLMNSFGPNGSYSLSIPLRDVPYCADDTEGPSLVSINLDADSFSHNFSKAAVGKVSGQQSTLLR